MAENYFVRIRFSFAGVLFFKELFLKKIQQVFLSVTAFVIHFEFIEDPVLHVLVGGIPA